MDKKFDTRSSLQAINVFIYVGLVFLFSGCQKKEIKDTGIVYSKKSSDSIQIEIDTLILKPLAFTEKGYFRIREDSLFYFDYLLLTVSKFSSEGDYLKGYLGKGNGPNEITSFEYHGFMPDGRSIFLGLSYDLSIYAKDWSRSQLVKYLDWGRTNRVYDKSDIDETGTYSFNFTNGRYDAKSLPVNTNEEFYMSLWISPGVNPSFHGYNGKVDYYKESHAIGLADAKTGKVIKVFGKKPSQYQDYETTPVFDFFNADVRGDSLFVAFAEADLIQVYSPNQELLYEFGIPGIDMDKNYEAVKDIETAEKIWQSEYAQKGYYYHIYASDDDMIFRSYTKNDSLGGLQVYEGMTLVGDFTVPKRFSVIGKIGDYFYADGYMNEETDQLGIYRFKLQQ